MNCKTCGRKISKKAKSCPECGHDYTEKSSGSGMIVIILFLLFIIISATSIPKSDTTKSYAKEKHLKNTENAISKNLEKEFEQKMNHAMKKIRGEKKVIAAAWSYNMFGKNIAKVSAGVSGNGQDRSGYAQYLCLIIGESGSLDGKYKKTVMVEITDAKRMITSKEKKILGEARCASR